MCFLYKYVRVIYHKLLLSLPMSSLYINTVQYDDCATNKNLIKSLIFSPPQNNTLTNVFIHFLKLNMCIFSAQTFLVVFTALLCQSFECVKDCLLEPMFAIISDVKCAHTINGISFEKYLNQLLTHCTRILLQYIV